MGRVYILNNVLIPSSADFEYSTDGSQYVVSDGFNPNNCKSTVTYYVTVDGNHYGSFTLDNNTVGFILDGLNYGSEYEFSAHLPVIGNLSLEMFDWDANGGPSGWRWIGSTDAVVSIYYDEDVKYFDNAELNNLWVRLVNTTEKLCNIDENEYIWTLTNHNHNYLTLNGTIISSNLPAAMDAKWQIVIGGGDDVYIPAVTSGYQLPISYLKEYINFGYTSFDIEIEYYIYDMDTIIGTKTHSSTLKPTKKSTRPQTVKEIHDALISHFGLERNNPPDTVGDYLKGISVAARYHNNECDIQGNPTTNI